MNEKQLKLFSFGDEGEKRKRNYVNLPLDSLILLLVVLILLLVLSFSLGIERGRKIALRDINKDVSMVFNTNQDRIIADNLANHRVKDKRNNIIEENRQAETKHISDGYSELQETGKNDLKQGPVQNIIEITKKEDNNDVEKNEEAEDMSKKNIAEGKNNKEGLIKENNRLIPSKGNKKEQKNKKEREYLIQVATYNKEKVALEEAANLKGKGYPVIMSKKGKFIVLFVGEFNNKNDATKNMNSLKKKYTDCFIRTSRL